MLLRGYSANPWDLRPWEMLADRFDVRVLVTPSNEYESGRLPVTAEQARALRDRLPSGRAARAAAYALGDRYSDLHEHLSGADIVHAAELHTWFSAQAAALRSRVGFRLVLTVWETIPFLNAYRWPRERRYRQATVPVADLLLPTTERARRTLLLEGVDPARLDVCPPGIDTTRFTAADEPAGSATAVAGDDHLILSPGRLVWEKGHQDVIRAVAALRRGLFGDCPPVRLLIVGSGPEEKRLRRHAAELGLGDAVQFRATVPYDEMPALYRAASGMVLASLPRRGWEEQFGMVLAEAMASGTPVAAARSGAIAEVVSPQSDLFEPGDWFDLARLLRDGPLSRPSAQRVVHDSERVERFSLPAAAQRIGRAYDRVLGLGSAGRSSSDAAPELSRGRQS